MQFDRSILTPQDYKDLSDALFNSAPRVRFIYSFGDLHALRISLIDQDNIRRQLETQSDYDRNKQDNDFMMSDEYNTIESRVLERSVTGFRGLIGIKNVKIVAYNPRVVNPEIRSGNLTGQLVMMDGRGWGNTYDAVVDFISGIAELNEEDQDVAHRLGLEYAPSGVREIDSLKASSDELHSNKKRIDEEGNPILYCDNPGCAREVRNPWVILDRYTGGLYHGRLCANKDLGLKSYLGVKGINPERVLLEEALEMFGNGSLQQSLNKKWGLGELRTIEPWPEGAFIASRTI